MRVFYYGCITSAGHYMHAAPSIPRREARESAYDFTYSNPWGRSVDANLCGSRSKPQVEGRALLHHKDGWTALAFWDRSVDTRMNSNSVFLAEGTHDFAAMVRIASDAFPNVTKRFAFPITQAPGVEQGAHQQARERSADAA